MCLISSSISLLTFNNFISKFPTLFFGFQKLCFPFYIIFSIHLLAIPHGMCDLRFPASVRTCAPEVEAQSLNTGLRLPLYRFLLICFFLSLSFLKFCFSFHPFSYFLHFLPLSVHVYRTKVQRSLAWM